MRVFDAAHCFDGHIDKNTVANAGDYEIVVSKSTKTYATVDNGSQKSYRVKEIRLYDQGYAGGSAYYTADVAILITSEKILIDVAVQPACVDWIRTRAYQPLEGTPGKLVGWESNDKANATEHYLIRFLSFTSRDRCLRRVPEDFKPYITSDKFCATSDDGSNDIPRSPGSGLLIREGSRYYLRGILSLKPFTDHYLATFTDLTRYVGWILRVRNEVEQQISQIPTLRV